jgi:hypothetical protein
VLNDVRTVLNQVVADVNAAWRLTEDTVILGTPRKPVVDANGNPVDYAVVAILEAIEREPHLRMVEERVRFDIVGWFSVPDDRPILTFQIEQAQALGEQLVPVAVETAGVMSSPAPYAGVCSSWVVSQVEFFDPYEPDDEDLAGVRLRFEVILHINE